MNRTTQRRMRTSRQLLNGPQFDVPVAVDEPRKPVDPPRVEISDELPEIPVNYARTGPEWWQVYRIEERAGQRVEVLIAQLRSEDQAIVAASRQKWLTTANRWNDRRPPYVNGKPCKVIP